MMSNDNKPTNSATNAVTGVLKIIHGSGDAIRGQINTLVDSAGEKLAGRKGSTPVTSSGERSVDIAERGIAEFKEGIAALKGQSSSSPRRSTSSARASPPKSPRSYTPTTTTTDATVTGGTSPLRRVPPPLHPQAKTTASGGYDPYADELRDSGVEAGRPETASLAPSDSTTTTTRAIYGSLTGHGEGVGNTADISTSPEASGTHEIGAASPLLGKHDAAVVQSPTRMDSYASGQTVYASAEDLSTVHAMENPPPLPPRSHA